MGYLSVNLQVQDKPIIIVGGGSVAGRKAGAILHAGARLTIISPTITFELQKLRDNGAISHVHREYRTGDITGAFMVIAATNRRDVNRALAEEAGRLGILAEITDAPAEGNVTSPAVFRQGDFSIAISTNNRAPALAARVRNEIADIFGPEYAKTVTIMGAVREKLLTDGNGSTYNKQVLRDLAEQLPLLIASGAGTEIDALLQRRLGPGYSLASLEPALEDPQ
ncbi:MAG TPA: bifunctional precorrin-2 dehydrogenase/sirohydrochlorin ferrochelatase [Geobacteraceae bacterium]|nr:bifunctional precorrin-2 dehydrogenase/sirohydrochlorin ferrochelatase [Geobacteraceae bacterium]